MDIFNRLNANEWEVFARYYLEENGYLVIGEPSVGPDGGIDLKVELGGFRCLVSCKNFSKSGKKVTAASERSIRDRLVQHGAEKFIGFYSTTADSNLLSILDNGKFEYEIIEGDAIVRKLNKLPFSIIQALMNREGIIQSKNFGVGHRKLRCRCGCGRDLLTEGNAGVSIVYVAYDGEEYTLQYRLLEHVFEVSGRRSRGFLLERLFDLRELNEFIEFLDLECGTSELSASSDFDMRFSYFLESVSQMLHP